MPNESHKDSVLRSIEPHSYSGHLIVVEGADGSGRSTQIALLTDHFENMGFKVANVGIKRSRLVSDELTIALSGNILSKRTMSLFYATDFADQVENTIIPALRAGFIVLCDRYIYTLMVRGIVRGLTKDWLTQVYSFSLIPDLIFYLKVNPAQLIERNLAKEFCLDYWESGMDMGLSDNLFDSFVIYQQMIDKGYVALSKEYPFSIIDGNQSVMDVFDQLRERVDAFLAND